MGLTMEIFKKNDLLFLILKKYEFKLLHGRNLILYEDIFSVQFL